LSQVESSDFTYITYDFGRQRDVQSTTNLRLQSLDDDDDDDDDEDGYDGNESRGNTNEHRGLSITQAGKITQFHLTA